MNADDRPDFVRGRQWHAMQANARREWAAMRELALTVLCRECKVAPGSICKRRDQTGQVVGELENLPAHPSRINDSKRKANR